MKQPRQLLIATKNAGKAREIQNALAWLPLELRSLDEFPEVDSVSETGTTYEENATLKATEYSRRTGLLALADDSGLEVEALNGQPGVNTARYADPGASDDERMAHLLAALGTQPGELRSARFVCSVVLAGVRLFGEETHSPETHVLHVTRGECDGVIARTPRGSNGFGYDPIFIPDGYDSTFAELSDEIKQEISHRARALRSMRAFLETFLAAT